MNQASPTRRTDQQPLQGSQKNSASVSPATIRPIRSHDWFHWSRSIRTPPAKSWLYRNTQGTCSIGSARRADLGRLRFLSGRERQAVGQRADGTSPPRTTERRPSPADAAGVATS